jgi:UDP-N-acetylmuramoyl-tripeptide--D-alanyl-D-alanine ligase
MLGRHLAASVAGAVLIASLVGVSVAHSCEALADVVMPGFRMKVVHQGEKIWLLDMYNSAPASLLAALDVAHDLRGGRPLVLALGEMRELGEATESAHRHAGSAAAKLRPLELLLLDAPMSTLHPTRYVAEAAIEGGMPASGVHICSSLGEMQSFLSRIPTDAVILVKGSRAVELEKALPEGVLI